MGWNSWDSYGRTLNEESIKANAKWMARHLKRFGWEYVVVDEGWYLANLDVKGNVDNTRFEIDAYGRYVPVPARFPSAVKDFSFRPLADYLHSLGLRFGIHIIRGIPREAVVRNLPIAGSSFVRRTRLTPLTSVHGTHTTMALILLIQPRKPTMIPSPGNMRHGP